MRRDYKTILKEKNIEYNEGLLDDLIADQPDKELDNSLTYIYEDSRDCWDRLPDIDAIEIIDHFVSLSDEQIILFCKDISEYESWAQLAENYADYDINVRKKQADLLETAEIILMVFKYYHEKIKPRQYLNSLKNTSTGTTDINKTHYDSLLDVVSGLPEAELNSPQFGNQFKVAWKAINGWLDVESEKWENDILTKIPKEKIGMYFLGKVTEFLDDFHDYVPYDREDWKKMQTSSSYFFYLAMDEYFSRICQLLVTYDVDKDEYTNKMDDLCWFFYDDEDDTEDYEKPNILMQNEDITAIIEKAIDTGLISETDMGYEWNKTLVLLAYFVEQINKRCNLYKITSSIKHGNKTRISWQPFEDLFYIKHGKLKGAKGDYMKNNTSFYPDDANLVDDLFDD